ncbi:membrane protein [Parapedobacter pyrenivorans]|uniref:Membrane protein n=1 Tax=Parapedobacter pyrenivorans TaxID=1305674 RepID=A0A917HY88_9SPHI|nr:PorP/SprF family type IX secretion system membrane protein [Parapedobacter pyrenivorans]GGG95491.1 membrane protein [Parapedobacter pyrenivorans]
MKFGTYPIFLAIVVLWIPRFSSGQQTPLFAAYHYDPFLINPAYSGMAKGSVISFNHNRYTRYIEGTPSSSALSFHTPLANDKMGVGATILDDRIGVASATTATLAYSYKIYFDHQQNRPYWAVYDQNVFSFGMTAGVQRLHENLLELGVEGDPEFANNLSETIPVIGAGVLYNRVGFYLGLSIPNLLGNRFASRDNLNLSTPIYGYFGYRFFTDLYKENMITPSLLVKYEKGAPVQIDANVSAALKNRFEIGAGYRTNSSVNFLLGFYPVEQLRLVYQYSVGFNHPVLGNNHGFALSYAFDYD